MGSTRLPGKVLADISGRPMLCWVVDRAGRSSCLDELLVATSDLRQDDPIEQLCRTNRVKVFRGHPTDVLDRFYNAARESQAEVVVRVTADCPLIDPVLIDDAVRAFLEASPPVDFVANRLPDRRTYPAGTDVEVCSRQALEAAWQDAVEPYQREHVMPYLYETPSRFTVLLLRSDQALSGWRLTVDTEPDLALVRAVTTHFAPRTEFGWQEVVAFLERHPRIAELNAGIQPRPYRRAG